MTIKYMKNQEKIILISLSVAVAAISVAVVIVSTAVLLLSTVMVKTIFTETKPNPRHNDR